MRSITDDGTNLLTDDDCTLIDSVCWDVNEEEREAQRERILRLARVPVVSRRKTPKPEAPEYYGGK